MNNQIREDYKNWILDYCSHLLEDYGDFSKLLEQLYSTEFYSVNERDTNREADGKGVRLKFAESTIYTHRDVYLYFYEDPVSVLEIILALADRMEMDIMYNPDYGDRTGLWMYIMLENLGLSEMDDFKHDPKYVKRVLIKFMERDYNFDGEGSLFCIPGTTEDMRDLEIWYQMHRFISYKYPISY